MEENKAGELLLFKERFVGLLETGMPIEGVATYTAGMIDLRGMLAYISENSDDEAETIYRIDRLFELIDSTAEKLGSIMRSRMGVPSVDDFDFGDSVH